MMVPDNTMPGEGGFVAPPPGSWRAGLIPVQQSIPIVGTDPGSAAAPTAYSQGITQIIIMALLGGI